MKARIKRIISPDARNPKTFSPKNPGYFGILVQYLIGPAGKSGEESFDVLVASPAWLAANPEHKKEKFLLKLKTYSYPAVVEHMQKHVDKLEEPTWEKLARKLAKIGKWEFSDYNK